VIARLRAFATGPAPEPFEAAALLRLVYLLVFGLQLLLAVLVGSLLAWLVPARGVPNDVVAVVLLVMGAFHLPLGWTLARSAVRAGGRQAALSGTIAGAVLFSIPAWFGVLLLVSGQRTLYLMGIAAVISVGYSLGFALTGVAARVAATPEPTQAPAGAEETTA
jgi:hypothetical protein